MNRQNAVVARNYASETYADSVSEDTNNINNTAYTTAQSANDDARRDDNLFNNEYTGTRRTFNNKLYNVGGEYTYITKAGAARKISGGIESDWNNTGNDAYVKFTGIPYSNCPDGPIELSTYNSISDLKSKNTSIFDANEITNPTLTACGAEGDIVYINKFMKYNPTKLGGDNRFQAGEGNGFVFLDSWKGNDWRTCKSWACKVACDSGYQVIKLSIGNIYGETYVMCYATDYNLDDLGVSETYDVNVPNNKSTAAGICDDSGKKYPKRTIDYFSSNSKVINGIDTITKNNGRISSQTYRTVGKGSNTRTIANKCTEYTEFTQPYTITCNEMSNYPTTIPDRIQRCNAVYSVWYQDVENTNVYVGNVGYITPDGEVQHISYTMLMYLDNKIDKLITYDNYRVCLQSKQYASNTDQVYTTKTNMSLEEAKIYLANNTDCAGFHMINNDTVTFFKKAGVQCGETLQTYNSMLPLTEDRIVACITVWKPLVYKIKNPNNKFLIDDNLNNTTYGSIDRNNSNAESNYYQGSISDYNSNVKNITGGCPYTIKSGYYGQLWYGYRNNGYTAESNTGFLCKTLQTTTTDMYNSYITKQLPASINQITNVLMPNLNNVTKTTNEIMNASRQNNTFSIEKFTNYTIEPLTTIEKEYGDEIVTVLGEKLPKKVTYNGTNYIIKNKNQLNSYGIINAQLQQGLITKGDANTQMNVLFTKGDGDPNSIIMKGKSDDTTTDDTTTDDTTTDDTTTDDTTTDDTTTDVTTSRSKVSKQKWKSQGPVEYPSIPSKSLQTINAVNKIAENPNGMNQQFGNMVTQITQSGNVLGDSKKISLMDEDSYVIMTHYFYGYGGWVLLAIIIVGLIVIYAFNLIPMLNNKTILLSLTVILGVISVILIVLKYNLGDLLMSFLNYFIYNN